jgi:hypothetical protein
MKNKIIEATMAAMCSLLNDVFPGIGGANPPAESFVLGLGDGEGTGVPLWGTIVYVICLPAKC